MSSSDYGGRCSRRQNSRSGLLGMHSNLGNLALGHVLILTSSLDVVRVWDMSEMEFVGAFGT